jgi:bis(5'-nucleosyl)-tetraphosphatase (symmetrical)
MATYAIGDIHGCFDPLQRLLEKINFEPSLDTLWFAGDLINGGPKPVETLRFIKELGPRHICILGNHDLMLLAVAAKQIPAPKDRKIGMEAVIQAADCAELCTWLSNRPIAHYNLNFNMLLVHAGVLPTWELSEILAYGNEITFALQSPEIDTHYVDIYGDLPDQWDPSLTGWDRIKFLIDCFTRMRFCTATGKLDLQTKGEVAQAPAGFKPWFEFPRHDTNNMQILFGHWAALRGQTGIANVHALDTGCVWGGELTALRLDDLQRISVINA